MFGVLRRLLLGLTASLLLVATCVFTAAPPVFASSSTTGQASTQSCPDGSTVSGNQVCQQVCPDGSKIPASEDCAVSGSGNCSGDTKGGKNLENCDLISKYINPLINLMSALVGVIIVIAIIIGGIQYSMSAGEPQKASAAKAHIRNAIIALIAFFLLYGMINFLVPGGVI